ncbi:protein unc-13 homolog D isoform X2 [Procambarus clarkii]|uniref:protein unc-13 homolog D isoform X2 n=1 Tax=Procambarus clarkii TaxID=6728 RepID=UPI003743B741
MFKNCVLSLRKHWKPTSTEHETFSNLTVAGSGGARDTGCAQGSGLARASRWHCHSHIQSVPDEQEWGRNRRERSWEEHSMLVASRVFTWPQEGPRRAYHAAVTAALHAHTVNLHAHTHVTEDRPLLWNGQLSQRATEDLNQLGIKLCLADDVQQLVWWLVGSRLATVDARWIYHQLETVQFAMARGKYPQEDVDHLLHSLTIFVYSQLKRLRSLHQAFPPGRHWRPQLTYTLRTLRRLEEDPGTRHLLDQTGQPVIHDDVYAALTRHATLWWGEVLGSWQGQAEGRLHSLMSLTREAHSTIKQDAHNYDHVFKSEMFITYTTISYREFSRHLAKIIVPLLSPTYPALSTPTPVSTPTPKSTTLHGTDGSEVLEDFSVGSPLWSLYRELARLHTVVQEAGERDSAADGERGDVEGFPSWFLGSVASWLNRIHHHTLARLQRHLLLDRLPNPPTVPESLSPAPVSLSPAPVSSSPAPVSSSPVPVSHLAVSDCPSVDPKFSSTVPESISSTLSATYHLTCAATVAVPGPSPSVPPSMLPPTSAAPSAPTYKSSFQELLSVFAEVRAWWEALEWPDEETSGALLVLVLENLCSLAVVCCQGLAILPPPATTHVATHPPPPPTPTPCFDLEFIGRVGSMWGALQSVMGLAGALGVEVAVGRLVARGRTAAASQVQDSVTNLTTSVAHNIDFMLDRTIDTAVCQVKSRLREAVEAACEAGKEEALLDHVITPTLALLRLQHLPSTLQQRLLQRLWDAVVATFMVSVNTRPQRAADEYWEGVYRSIRSSFLLLTSPGHLHPSSASTPGYRSLLEEAEEQRVRTQALIIQYYEAHYAHLLDHRRPTVAHLLLRTFYSEPGRLKVRVLEARDMVEGNESSSMASSRKSCQPRYYVVAQVVPRHMFPNAVVCTTAKARPASFYDTFEFPTGVIGKESAGWLEVLLMVAPPPRGGAGGGGAAAAGGGSCSLLGQGLLPLASLPYLGSPDLHNTCLRMTAPHVTASERGYRCLGVLRSRVHDPLAVSFCRILERYHSEVSREAPQGLRSAGRPPRD